MPSVQKSLRLPENIAKEINEIARLTRKDFTTVTTELIEEAIKAHHCPGIVFSEGVLGRRARIAGTGIEVWEVIATFKGVGEDLVRLQQSYHWLTELQLKAAIGYYLLYAEEIDTLIAESEQWTPEMIRQRYPFLAAGKP